MVKNGPLRNSSSRLSLRTSSTADNTEQAAPNVLELLPTLEWHTSVLPERSHHSTGDELSDAFDDSSHQDDSYPPSSSDFPRQPASRPSRDASSTMRKDDNKYDEVLTSFEQTERKFNRFYLEEWMPRGQRRGFGVLKAEAYTKPFCDFLTENPTVFHAVDYFKNKLAVNGFKPVWPFMLYNFGHSSVILSLQILPWV
jgi:hypothetical protein